MGLTIHSQCVWGGVGTRVSSISQAEVSEVSEVQGATKHSRECREKTLE